MMALVRAVTLAASKSGSRFHVSGWQSTTTGIAPARAIAEAQEIMVKLGKITSSPAPILRAASATSMATLPLLTAMPCAQPISLEKPVSSFLTNGPSEEIQPVSMHSFKYFFSLPLSSGRLTGIILLLEIQLCRQLCGKPRFVRITDIRALLDLDHVELFEHFKAMPSRDQQDDIARAKQAAHPVLLLLSIEIDAQFALPNEQRFLRV